MTPASDTWDGGWDADRRTKREAWSTMSPADRLAWLEEALELAHATGALAADRRRRQLAADRMGQQLH